MMFGLKTKLQNKTKFLSLGWNLVSHNKKIKEHLQLFALDFLYIQVANITKFTSCVMQI